MRSRTAELLRHPAEQALIRHLLDFPDASRIAAERRETHEVPRYAYELASAFSAFYRDCKVLTEDEALIGCAPGAGRRDAHACSPTRLGPARDLRARLDVARRRQSAASVDLPQEVLGRRVHHEHLAVRQLA